MAVIMEDSLHTQEKLQKDKKKVQIMMIFFCPLVVPWQGSRKYEALGAMHYGLTGEWDQKLKASYLLCFLHCALVFKARGQCDHHNFPLA